jgi:hypothetical protein
VSEFFFVKGNVIGQQYMEYSVLSIYRFSGKWRKQSMNAGKREIRKNHFFLTKKVAHCLLLLGRILPQLKI